MTVKELESMIQEMEREQSELLEKSQQKMQLLKDEMARMKKERSAEQNFEGTGIREYLMERGRHFFGDHVLMPDDASELVEWMYEATNGKVKEEQVVFAIDEKSFSELEAMNSFMARMMPDVPLVSINKCLLFFCEDRLVVLEPDYELDGYDLAAMFRYEVVDRVFRFDDGLRIDVTDSARQYEDYDGDLHRLPELYQAIEKPLPKLLLKLRDFVNAA